MRDRGETINRGPTHLVAGAVGSVQFRVGLFQSHQIRHLLVVLMVTDFRRRIDVVETVVPLNFSAQNGNPVVGTWFRHRLGPAGSLGKSKHSTDYVALGVPGQVDQAARAGL